MSPKINGNVKMASIIVAVVIATITATQTLSGDSAMTKSNEKRLYEQEKTTALIMDKLITISEDVKEVKRNVNRLQRHNPTPPR